MKLFFLCIAFKVILVSGSSPSDKVKQTPAEMFIQTGQPTRINCSHSIQDYTQIFWYKQLKDGQLQLLGYMNVNQGFPEPGADVKIEGSAMKDQLCTLTLNKPSESSHYYCAARGDYNAEAYFGSGTKLTVLETGRQATAPTVKLLKPSPNECQKKNKTLVCLGSGFYPDHVSVIWQVNGDDAIDGVATDSVAKREEKLYSITSRLRIPAEVWDNPKSRFTCTVRFYDGLKHTNYEDTIYGVQGIVKQDEMTREKYLKITQTAKLSYGVFIFKSIIYGLFVAFLVWKLKRPDGKHT